jgi:(p)ppGpp synthase/HD superfamily hydrolase
LPLHGIWGYLLHDTIEDTKTTGTELRRLFGTKVAGILRDILASPPKDWSIERKRQYFDWAKKVIDQVRGTNSKLERRFDQLYRRRPGA